MGAFGRRDACDEYRGDQYLCHHGESRDTSSGLQPMKRSTSVLPCFIPPPAEDRGRLEVARVDQSADGR